MAVEWKILKDKGELHVFVRGRFDFSQYQALQALFQLSESELSVYILDLGEVDYVDSSAVGILLELHEHAQSMNVEVRLVRCNDDLLSLFQAAELDSKFSISS